tara:strand:+ start:1872 stop:1985 length:114 start_codon:yes stop_codon:yes gene_type:complete
MMAVVGHGQAFQGAASREIGGYDSISIEYYLPSWLAV